MNNLISMSPGLFRLLLASLVVVSHVSRYDVGRPAVFIFFVLSGYWVYRMYDSKYRRFSNPVKAFYLSRFLRIWLFFVVCCLVAIVLSGHFVPEDLYALLIIGVASRSHDPLGVSWSLDYEIQFYLLLPLIWLLFNRITDLQIAVLSISHLVIVMMAGAHALETYYGILTVFGLLPLFLAGCLLARLDYCPSVHAAAISLVLTAVAVIAVYFVPATHDLLIKDAGNPITKDLFFIFISGMLLPFIAYNVSQKSDGLDRHAGNWSYALYLLHSPIITATYALMAAKMGQPALKIVAVACAYGGSLLMYLLIDARIERWRTRKFEAIR